MEPINEHDKRVLNNAPFGQLGLITASGCKEMGTEIDHYLTQWRAERQDEHPDNPSYSGYKQPTYIINSKVPRFGTGEGKGVLSMTGNLGDVMKESAQIAYQYIKAHPEMAKITSEQFAEKDIHVHVPEGATPKDGPSAGITMVCSMVSALRGEGLRKGVAMTGEMTLRGRVLPVGGIKEKILAAKRAGVHTIVISEDNRKDIEDIKEIYVKGLEFIYVKTIDDVISFVFE